MLPVTISGALAAATIRLQDAGVDTSQLDARLLLQEAATIDHADIISSGNRVLGLDEAVRFERFIVRRCAREPVHRILGKRQFWGLELDVSPAVLEPRADTERLIEAVLEWVDVHSNRLHPLRIADIGTGSGAIVVALLSELKNATAVAVDICEEALTVARANACKYELGERIQFVQGSHCQPLTGMFDLVLSNPPYISTPEIEDLAPEVRNFDPLIALDGGVDGLDAYRQLLAESINFLTVNGAIFFEIGHDQATDITHMALKSGWQGIKILQDLAGNDRVFQASR